jgi:hypothetical protein
MRSLFFRLMVLGWSCAACAPSIGAGPDWRAEGFFENVGLDASPVRYSMATPLADVAVLADGTLLFSVGVQDAPRTQFDVRAGGFGGWSQPVGSDRLPDDVRLVTHEVTLRVVGRYRELTMRAESADVLYLLRRSSGGVPEQIFQVGPGVDPESLSLTFGGVSKIEVLRDGMLALRVGNQRMEWSAPKAWQFSDEGDIEVVRVSYRVDGSRVGFDFDRFDPARPLHVDPYLARSYHGGAGEEAVDDVERLWNGNVLIAGRSSSLSFPGLGAATPAPTYSYVSLFTPGFASRLATIAIPEALGGGTDSPLLLEQHAGSSSIYAAWRGNPGGVSPLRLRRYDATLSGQIGMIDVSTTADHGALLAFEVNASSGDVYSGVGHRSRSSGEEDGTLVLRFSMDLASALSTRVLPLIPRDGLALRESAPYSVHAATIHDRRGHYPHGSAPTFQAGTGVQFQNYSADLALTGTMDFTVAGWLRPKRLEYDRFASELLLFGTVESPSMPSTVSGGARQRALGHKDIFVTRYSPIFGVRSNNVGGIPRRHRRGHGACGAWSACARSELPCWYPSC